VNLRSISVKEMNEVSATVGSFDTARALVIAAPSGPGFNAILAGETYFTNGPFQNQEDLLRYNLFGKVTTTVQGGTLSLAATSYASGWNASGQIPDRAVENGTLDRFGTEDTSEGGNS
jgi:hypothetical protein